VYLNKFGAWLKETALKMWRLVFHELTELRKRGHYTNRISIAAGCYEYLAELMRTKKK